jgi:hypothetical protein
MNPSYAEPYKNLGLLLNATYRQDEAEDCFHRAIKLSPDFADTHYYLGTVLIGANRLEEAEKCLKQAITLRPDYAEADFALGMLYLLLGQYDKGWKGYEERCRLPGYPQMKIPRWQGEDLTGRKILLYQEQGFGDTIQFIRYARQVAELAEETIVWVQKPLEKLLNDGKGGFLVYTGDGTPLNKYNFDFACPLLSLPRLFNTSIETIPQKTPYLLANSDISAKWREALAKMDGGSVFRIGVVWTGGPKQPINKYRSIPLDLLAELFAAYEVSWVSLQVGSQTDELAGMPYKLADLSKELTDFAETAGVIDNLDLVITVDTAVAHLAGSMGKKTWLVLPFASDWRWLLEREDSPWYPTMRLFRQSHAGAWQEVLTQVKAALAEEIMRGC